MLLAAYQTPQLNVVLLTWQCSVQFCTQISKNRNGASIHNLKCCNQPFSDSDKASVTSNKVAVESYERADNPLETPPPRKVSSRENTPEVTPHGSVRVRTPARVSHTVRSTG